MKSGEEFATELHKDFFKSVLDKLSSPVLLALSVFWALASGYQTGGKQLWGIIWLYCLAVIALLVIYFLHGKIEMFPKKFPSNQLIFAGHIIYIFAYALSIIMIIMGMIYFSYLNISQAVQFALSFILEDKMAKIAAQIITVGVFIIIGMKAKWNSTSKSISKQN
ncbi:MAG: hypothetical protein AABX01_08340 [Candidatus Micrarchaeota archaeon]